MKTSKDIIARKVKVHDLHSPRKSGIYCTVPQIRLCGKWLGKAGFKVGDDIKVITMNKCLLIVLDENESLEL